MSGNPRSESASFEINAHDIQETVVAGFSQFGLAGLTAVDYLVDHLDFEQVGHITADQLPAITPFEDGQPRHHTRVFSHADAGLSVLVGELFVPAWAAQQFSEAVLEWTETEGIEEVAVLHGVPIPHGPEEHQVFYVATDDYRERRLADAEIPPMGRGFLDGMNAELLARGMESDLRTATFLTPVHGQAPDVEAAIRLLDATQRVYDLDVTRDRWRSSPPRYRATTRVSPNDLPSAPRPTGRRAGCTCETFAALGDSPLANLLAGKSFMKNTAVVPLVLSWSARSVASLPSLAVVVLVPVLMVNLCVRSLPPVVRSQSFAGSFSYSCTLVHPRRHPRRGFINEAEATP